MAFSCARRIASGWPRSLPIGTAPQKHAWRAQVVLLTADRVGTAAIMRRTGLGKPSVWRWQERYIEAGIDGLLRDKTRPSRIPPLDDAKVANIVRRTLEEKPPGGASHWTVREMALASGVSPAKVHRIWQEAGLAPHRCRLFKLSNDPAFADKLEEVVALYVDPPQHAVILSIDEKSQIQALDRTQPGLPMKKGRAGTLTHDYIRPVSSADIPPGDRAGPMAPPPSSPPSTRSTERSSANAASATAIKSSWPFSTGSSGRSRPAR